MGRDSYRLKGFKKVLTDDPRWKKVFADEHE